jgi:hypothetical protein
LPAKEDEEENLGFSGVQGRRRLRERENPEVEDVDEYGLKVPLVL